MKVCTRCHIEKEDSEFRIRTDKSRGKVYVMLNSTCRKCDSELQRIYYEKNKNNPIFIEKNRKRNREYADRNKIIISRKNKVKRASLEYKKYVSEYRKKNYLKIHEQEKITKNKYHKKHLNPISDRYCARLLHLQGYGKVSELIEDKDLIEIKRIQVLKKRIKVEIIKNKKYGKKND